jgi:hypothetical protein
MTRRNSEEVYHRAGSALVLASPEVCGAQRQPGLQVHAVREGQPKAMQKISMYLPSVALLQKISVTMMTLSIRSDITNLYDK